MRAGERKTSDALWDWPTQHGETVRSVAEAMDLKFGALSFCHWGVRDSQRVSAINNRPSCNVAGFMLQR